MKKIAVAFVLMLALTGCSDSDKALSALENEGLTNIKVGGYAFFGCGESDTIRNTFEATRELPNGKSKQVKGVICSGWGPFGKGATVRYD